LTTASPPAPIAALVPHALTISDDGRRIAGTDVDGHGQHAVTWRC